MNADSNNFKRGWPWICAPATALLTHDRTLIHLHWTWVLAWSCMYVSAAGRTRGYVELMHLDYSSENNKKIRGQASLGKKVISKISPIWIINSRQTFHWNDFRDPEPFEPLWPPNRLWDLILILLIWIKWGFIIIWKRYLHWWHYLIASSLFTT